MNYRHRELVMLAALVLALTLACLYAAQRMDAQELRDAATNHMTLDDYRAIHNSTRP